VTRKASVKNPQEGDYIETIEGLFFAVKGNRHPDDRIIAYLRYIPSVNGDRILNDVHYRRLYDLDETTKLIRESYPQYFSHVDWLDLPLQVVPRKMIKKYYEPRQQLNSLRKDPKTSLEKSIIWFVENLSKESGVDFDHFGVSGSVLVELHTEESDIDLNVYGKNHCIKVYNALKKLRKESPRISPYTIHTVKKVVYNRWGDTGLDLDRLAETEIKKILHGTIDKRDYFIRLIPEPSEHDNISKPIGHIKLTATIGDDEEMIFTPCRYKLDAVHSNIPYSESEPRELLSFRGKFTEQASVGELVEVRGVLEKVTSNKEVFFRVVLGGKGDYLVPLDF
jgi:predicted nucleotidyltransferase